jgi:Rod binding domain-containing protein
MEIRSIGGAQAPGTVLNAENPKLKTAAHEFEASLMKEFLKPLQHDSLFSDDKDGDSEDDEGSNGSLMSLGSQAMAQAISERGGFGIATKILDHFRSAPGGASAQITSPSE